MSENTVYMKRSPITGRKYDYFSKDIVRILNMSQAFYYVEECGIVPLDITLSDDRRRPGRKVIIFIFSREETRDAYATWCEREHVVVDKD